MWPLSGENFFFLCKHVPAITLDLSHKSVPFLHYRGYLKKKLTTEYSYYLCNRFHCQFWPKLLYYFPWYRTPRVCQVLILFAKFGWIWPYTTWWYMMHVYQCMCNKYNYVLEILKTCQNKLVTHSPLCSQYRSMSLYFSSDLYFFLQWYPAPLITFGQDLKKTYILNWKNYSVLP